MKLAEVLRVLHQMHKETTRLLFEGSVSESEVIRKAVAKADLALGNAASLVRQHLVGPHATGRTGDDAQQESRPGKAFSQKSPHVPEKHTAVPQCAAPSNGTESATEAAGVPAEDGLPDEEYTVQVGRSSWEYLDSIQHPDDRPCP